MKKRWSGVFGAVLLVVLASLLGPAGRSHGEEYTVVPMEVGPAEDYKIAPSDVLEITVYGEEGLARNQLVVRPDGKVSFPLIGDVEVGGLNTSQVKGLSRTRSERMSPKPWPR